MSALSKYDVIAGKSFFYANVFGKTVLKTRYSFEKKNAFSFQNLFQRQIFVEQLILFDLQQNDNF